MSADLQAALARYAGRFESMTPDTLATLSELFSPGVHFRDPFNDVHGSDALVRVMRHMYESCGEARFEVHEYALAGEVGLLAWSFHYRLRRFQPERLRRIDGMSRVLFDAEGRVTEHIDHWDAAAQVYEGVPLIGTLLRALRRRLAA